MMYRNIRRMVAACSLVAVVFCPLTAAAQSDESAIAARIEQIEGGLEQVGGASVLATSFIPEFYSARSDRPAWSGSKNSDNLFAEIALALGQGFLPLDFHMPLLAELRDKAMSGAPEDVATYEIVATDAAARLVHHIIYGKVDPEVLDPAWNFSRPVIGSDPAEVLNSYLDGEGFSALLDRLVIDNLQYLQMVDALTLYNGIQERGGWPEVPSGPPLKPEMEDPRVPILRERLAWEGDYLGEINGDVLYDATLARAVETFQLRHGLDADAVIGPKTLRAMNRTAGERVDQLRLSLERFRWFVRGLDQDFVLVNIGGGRTTVVLGGEIVWSTRSITGSQYRQTPVFRDEIKYLEFNPTWTVPASIFSKDLLPKIRADPSYLGRNKFVVRNSEGEPIPAETVNWASDRPAVSLMQRPGPGNALGRVKFMFPNKYAVYLHDTNDHSLFDRADRTLSSGCVRVEDPLVFAGLLMGNDPSWTQARMQEILDSGKTTRVDLPEPMPVMMTYWTAWIEDGEVQFREDIYDRDQKVLEALNARF